MEKRTKELEVDFLGGQGSLTIEEEKALSEFFRKRKQVKNRPSLKSRTRIAKRQKSET